MRKAVILYFTVLSIGNLNAQEQPVNSDAYRFNDLKVEKEATRERRQVLEGSTRDLEILEIHTTTLEPGKSPHPPHTHDDVEEMIIIKEGKLRVTIKDKSKILGPGSVALAIPGEEHGFENGGDTRTTYYVVKYKSKTPMDLERGKKAGGSFMIDWHDIAAKEHEKGSRRNFFDHPTSMTNRFEMHVTQLKTGLSSHPPHTHRAEEIILVIEGDVSMQIGDRQEKASVGDLVFLGSEVPHNLTNIGSGSCTYFAFQW
jgi:(S)-ureidoglycine aminohydrolase